MTDDPRSRQSKNPLDHLGEVLAQGPVNFALINKIEEFKRDHQPQNEDVAKVINDVTTGKGLPASLLEIAMEPRKSELGRQIRTGDFDAIQKSMKEYAQNPDAFSEKLPGLQAELKARGISVEYNVKTIHGDPKDRQCGVLTLKKDGVEIEFNTLDSSNGPVAGRRWKDAQSGAEHVEVLSDPRQALERITSDMGKYRHSDENYLTPEQVALNKLHAKFADVADSLGCIKSAEQIEDHIRKHGKEMGREELRGWQFLADNFDSIKGASVIGLDKVFNRYKMHEGLNRDDIHEFLQQKKNAQMPQVIFLPIPF